MSTTRRDFLKTSLSVSAATSLGASLPVLAGRPAVAAPARPTGDDTILIVVQLAGGNDGLNTVVPYEDDLYARNRPTLRLTPDEVHKIAPSLGLHPRMKAFARLFDEGHLGIVQGVGYPNPNQSHPRSMEIWQTARPDQNNCQTGWLGRVSDELCSEDAARLPAVFVGQIGKPLAVNAATCVVPSILSAEQYKLRAPASPGRGLPRGESDNQLLDFLQKSTEEACAASRRLEEVVNSSGNSSGYPAMQLAGAFSTVAQLIRAELGIRIFYTELGGNQPGGFDNHANQLGNHCALLHQLSESVAALVDDLKRDGLLDRVVVTTFSEFGRTLAENGRHGTGHGIAAPMFLAGGRLKGGLVGDHPSLSDIQQGSPKFHIDFRQVYATLLDGWLGVDSRTVLGGTFKPLDLIEG